MAANVKNNIDEISKEDFLLYGGAVIKSRAIPTVEDNMKPVHKRILYTMYDQKLWSNKKTKKSANVTGVCMAKYHPHGDSSIYDAMVRLSQDFKMRYPLVDIQGNNGNIDGDSAAAPRYTEARLSPIGDYMVKELKENCVEMVDTYDGENKEPVILPSAFPNILCNANMGIAVAMSSSLVPHNLKEVVAGINAYMDTKGNIQTSELMKLIKGPDFPTGGVITDAAKLQEAYMTGKGSIKVRARYRIEEVGKQSHIVVTEIPYLVSVSEGIMKPIKDLVIEEGYEDIENVEKNIGKDGFEIRIILKPKVNVNRVLKTLFEKTRLEVSIKIGQTVIINNKPVVVGLKGLVKNYINHRHDILTKIATNQKQNAEGRLHIVEGLIIATKDIDGVIEIVKNSADRDAAKLKLQENYSLSEIQASAILNMRISQINKLDTTKLVTEEKDLKLLITDKTEIINSVDRRNKIIKEQLKEIEEKFGDERKTTLDFAAMEDMATKQDMSIFMFKNNEAMILSEEQFPIANKGTKGKKIFNKPVINGLHFNTGNVIVALDEQGKTYRIDGRLLQSEESVYLNDIDTRINGDINCLQQFTKEDFKKEFLVFVTKNGTVKKTALEQYKEFKSATVGIKLKDGDTVISFGAANNDDFIFILGKGKLVKFLVSDIKATGKATIGSKGMSTDEILGAAIVGKNNKLFSCTEDGKGKVTAAAEFTLSSKGTKGQVIPEETTSIGQFNNGHITFIGSDGKSICVETSSVPTKSAKSNGIKLYGGDLATTIF